MWGVVVVLVFGGRTGWSTVFNVLPATVSAQCFSLRLCKKTVFTNEMGGGVGGRTGQKQRASMPLLLKIAIHGDFPLGIWPFHK